MVAADRCQREPLVGFREVLLDPDAAGIEDGEIVLAVRDAEIRPLAEPLHRRLVVRLAVDALGVDPERQVVDVVPVEVAGSQRVTRPVAGLGAVEDATGVLVDDLVPAGQPAGQVEKGRVAAEPMDRRVAVAPAENRRVSVAPLDDNA